LTSDIPEFPEDKMNILEGKYEVFEVGEEIVLSNDREKVKKYARRRGEEQINYKMSLDNIENVDWIDKKIL